LDTFFKIVKYVLFYSPAVFGFHTWLYSKYPKYYFFFVRLTSKMRDTTWSVNCWFKVELVEDIYQKIENVLKKNYKNNKYSRIINMKNKKFYECGFFNIIVQDDFNEGEFSCQKIYLKIPPLNVTLSAAEERLQELRKLFNDLERELKPQQTGYNLDVYFSKGFNPFFGLMVQRLGKNNIQHFECSFPISSIVSKKYTKDANEQFLRVFKDKISINAVSFDILEETARKALLFK